jgi:hypothetical protein
LGSEQVAGNVSRAANTSSSSSSSSYSSSSTAVRAAAAFVSLVAVGGAVHQYGDAPTSTSPSSSEAAVDSQQGGVKSWRQIANMTSRQSPFVYDSLTEGIQQRVQSQKELQLFQTKVRQELRTMFEEAQAQIVKEGGTPSAESVNKRMSTLMAEFRDKVIVRNDQILYGAGVEPHARERYLEQYGCARWTAEALKTVKACAPLVEVGAGQGHWQRQLSDLGADIVSFDSHAQVPLANKRSPKAGVVYTGDERVLSAYQNRTLFLCYPPDGVMGVNCLRKYTGNRIVYVGEGRGGVNANPAFFALLERDWVVDSVEELDPFPECFEKLFVLSRRSK